MNRLLSYLFIVLISGLTFSVNANSKIYCVDEKIRERIENFREEMVAVRSELRKVQNESAELEELEMDQDDDFDKIYKGEISKSGAAILPSKRVRKIPEKINVSPKLEDEKKEEQTDQEPEEKITSDAEKKE